MTTTADLHDVTLRTAVPEDLVDVEELLLNSKARARHRLP